MNIYIVNFIYRDGDDFEVNPPKAFHTREDAIGFINADFKERAKSFPIAETDVDSIVDANDDFLVDANSLVISKHCHNGNVKLSLTDMDDDGYSCHWEATMVAI